MKRQNNYFAPGPCHLPEEVLREAQDALLNFDDTGLSIVEIGHRTHKIDELLQETIELLQELLSIPKTHKIIFMSGGASNAFANIQMNLKNLGNIGHLITGRWSNLAYHEAIRIAPNLNLKLYDGSPTNYTTLPTNTQLETHNRAIRFIHYTTNETVDGVQFTTDPEVASSLLISDMTSDILTRSIDFNKYAIAYASTTKNIGASGLHLLIINEEILDEITDAHLPNIYNFKNISSNNSLYNTIAIFQLFMANLMLKWTKKQGGISHFNQKIEQQAQLIYSIIDKHPNLYVNKVQEHCRSKVNIIFDFNELPITEKFLADAIHNHLLGLKGHKAKGGIRLSLYNSISLDQVKLIADFMENFALTL